LRDCPGVRDSPLTKHRTYTGSVAQQRVIGVVARGTSPDAPATREIKGSTTIVELLRMFPDGEAGRLMSTLALPCAHCGGAFHEPLTMAAKRHRRDPRAVLEAFRALEAGGPNADQVDAARRRVSQD
jgi:hypothetical protein